MRTTEIICLLISFAAAAVSGLFVVPLMKRLKFGQTERDNGVKTHLSKTGTPTMGGWIFLIPMVLVMAVLAIIKHNFEYLALPVVAVLFGTVGFADDMLKIKKKSKDGLSWWQKMLALLAVSVAFALYMQLHANKGAAVNFMFLGSDHTIRLGWFYVPFIVFVMIAESNAVNLTDGLDGLCGGCCAIVFMFFMMASAFAAPNANVSAFSAISVGALAGYMIYNFHPAKIFMGDTGSLALGGVLGATAIMMNHPFMLFFSGFLFVLEALSVLLQVGYFKISGGRRIFKMAPLHHHFEMCGWKETKVTFVFWLFTAVCSVLTYLFAGRF